MSDFRQIRAAQIVLCAVLMLAMERAASSSSADEPRVEYAISQISSNVGGLQVYVPDRWGMLHLNLANPLDRDVEILCATAFDSETTLQYGRRIWLPPHSRTKTWHLVKLPKLAKGESLKVPFRTSVMEAGGGSEALIRDDSGKMQLTSVLQLSEPGTAIGMIGPRGSDDAVNERRIETHQVVTVARAYNREPARTTELSDPVLPLLAESLQSVDVLVIADGYLQDDDAALSAIRRWLYDGGRLWILLEQVAPRFMEQLLGDEWSCEVIDHVGLTSVRFQSGAPNIPGTEHTSDFEKPVDLVRTIVDEAEVRYTVNGWPAVFWKKCGRGGMLVTTLGPRAWLRPRTERDPPLKEQGRILSTSHVATDALATATTDLFEPRQAELAPANVLEPQMRDYVGYSIPSRQVVVGLLGCFGLLLIGSGAWLWRAGRLEQFGIYGTLLASAFSVVLLAIGRQNRNAVPPTVSQVQIVEPIPGTDDVQLRGTAGHFTNESAISRLSGNGGGWLMPDMTGITGTTRRLVWTDLDKWQWENLSQSTGLRNSVYRVAKRSPERAAALGTFGPEGVRGRLSLPEGLIAEDAVLATRDGRIGVSIDAAGGFTATADQVFSREQFLSAGLMSDEQNRRSKTLQELLGNSAAADYPQRPLLMFWTAPWPVGLEFGDVTRRAGSALVALPVQFERPADGSEVLIPSPLLPYRGVLGPDGHSPTGMYDFRKREWVEKTGSTSSWFRFQLPQVLLPLEPLQARLTVKVSGPMGKLQVSGWKQGKMVPLKTWMDPVGTLSFELTDLEVMRLTDDGGLLLLITGGDPDRPELTKVAGDSSGRALYWQIDALTLNVRARVGSVGAQTSPDESRAKN